MSRRKDRDRAKHTVYRHGVPVSVKQIQRKDEIDRLNALGLERGKANIILPGKSKPKKTITIEDLTRKAK